MNWYEDDVLAAIHEREHCTYRPETIFYGSSTFRLWTTLYEDFAVYKPLNLGFGGSTLAACVWFFDRIIAPLSTASRFVLYAGDNDLGDGRHPEEVFLFYHEFRLRLREFFPHIPFYFVSIKPSIDREEILDKIIHTNELVARDIAKKKGNDYFINVYESMIDGKGRPLKKFFKHDGLHLNTKGYAMWREVLLKALQ